jgi:hypothetical protein
MKYSDSVKLTLRNYLDLDHLDMSEEEIQEATQKELDKLAAYNRQFMEKLYSKNPRADQIEAVKEVLLERAITDWDIDACIYILEHQDWFLEDLTQLPKEKK